MLITMKDQPPIRKEIMDFAMAMERAMREHDKDRGESWTVMTTGELIDRLNQESDELKEALVIQETSDDPPENEDPLKECADVANIAMMLWNNIKYNQEEEAKEAAFLKSHPQDAGRYGG